MSKPTRKTPTTPPASQRPAATPPAPPADASAVPVHRQCPLCFAGNGGVGTCYSSQDSTRYYKCDCCGHTWTATVSEHETRIVHRTVEVNERGG